MKNTAPYNVNLLRSMKCVPSGFSLIELTVVVAIMGVLASIAYPLYQSQVQKTKEAEAQAALVSLANVMSQYYFDNMTYVGASVGSGGIFTDQVPVDGGTKTYTLSIPTKTKTAFTVKAVPVDGTLKTFCLDEEANKTDCNGANNW